MRDLNELPTTRQRSDRYVERDNQIELCLSLEVEKGKEIPTSNPGAWKTAFYKKWKEKKDEQTRIETEHAGDEKISVIVDYKSMEFTIQSQLSNIKIWRIK